MWGKMENGIYFKKKIDNKYMPSTSEFNTHIQSCPMLVDVQLKDNRTSKFAKVNEQISHIKINK
jgi:hypothetical protein